MRDWPARLHRAEQLRWSAAADGSRGRLVLLLGFGLGLTACGNGLVGDGSPYLLTSRGDEVLSEAPPGVEVTLGTKLVRPAGEPRLTSSAEACASGPDPPPGSGLCPPATIGRDEPGQLLPPGSSVD